jgi:hypothetical protein
MFRGRPADRIDEIFIEHRGEFDYGQLQRYRRVVFALYVFGFGFLGKRQIARSAGSKPLGRRRKIIIRRTNRAEIPSKIKTGKYWKRLANKSFYKQRKKTGQSGAVASIISSRLHRNFPLFSFSCFLSGKPRFSQNAVFSFGAKTKICRAVKRFSKQKPIPIFATLLVFVAIYRYAKNTFGGRNARG